MSHMGFLSSPMKCDSNYTHNSSFFIDMFIYLYMFTFTKTCKVNFLFTFIYFYFYFSAKIGLTPGTALCLIAWSSVRVLELGNRGRTFIILWREAWGPTFR